MRYENLGARWRRRSSVSLVSIKKRTVFIKEPTRLRELFPRPFAPILLYPTPLIRSIHGVYMFPKTSSRDRHKDRRCSRRPYRRSPASTEETRWIFFSTSERFDSSLVDLEWTSGCRRCTRELFKRPA